MEYCVVFNNEGFFHPPGPETPLKAKMVLPFSDFPLSWSFNPSKPWGIVFWFWDYKPRENCVLGRSALTVCVLSHTNVAFCALLDWMFCACVHGGLQLFLRRDLLPVFKQVCGRWHGEIHCKKFQHCLLQSAWNAILAWTLITIFKCLYRENSKLQKMNLAWGKGT